MRGGGNLYRLNIKRLLAVAAAAGLLLLILRGCVAASCARKPAQEPGIQPPVASGITLTLYDTDNACARALGLEEYVVGVVAAEMPASYAMEALKAQAVTARTFALRRIQSGGCDSGLDICSDSGCCQAYDTDAALQRRWGADYAGNLNKLRSAVSDTAGQALYYEGALIEALYHAASGGRTENSEHVFSAALPYLTGVESANEVGSSHLTDTVTYSRREFEQAVNAAFPKAKLRRAKLETQVEVLSRYDSGRVEALRLGGVTVSGREFRQALELRSALFYITVAKDRVSIDTKGYGHGVGMSQTGANGMAKDGADYRAILYHYYTGVTLR